jgi:hypothetical protein
MAVPAHRVEARVNGDAVHDAARARLSVDRHLAVVVAQGLLQLLNVPGPA